LGNLYPPQDTFLTDNWFGAVFEVPGGSMFSPAFAVTLYDLSSGSVLSTISTNSTFAVGYDEVITI
jgi:hypothetical protein